MPKTAPAAPPVADSERRAYHPQHLADAVELAPLEGGLHGGEAARHADAMVAVADGPVGLREGVLLPLHGDGNVQHHRPRPLNGQHS